MTETINPHEEKLGDGLRLLTVEDIEANQKLIELFLRDQPVQVDKAENGREAVEMHLKEPYDGILMDIQMPVMDGFEATRKIRLWERQNNRPPVAIIALTAFAFKLQKDQCFESGCNEFLSKPINKKELIEKIGKLLTSR